MQSVTTHAVRLKLFRLKAEGNQEPQLTDFGGEKAGYAPHMAQIEK